MNDSRNAITRIKRSAPLDAEAQTRNRINLLQRTSCSIVTVALATMLMGSGFAIDQAQDREASYASYPGSASADD
jgi:hypothetical protein